MYTINIIKLILKLLFQNNIYIQSKNNPKVPYFRTLFICIKEIYPTDKRIRL